MRQPEALGGRAPRGAEMQHESQHALALKRLLQCMEKWIAHAQLRRPDQPPEADYAYPSDANHALLAKLGLKPRFQHKRRAGQELTLRQRKENLRRSGTRARVEHVFAQQCSSKPGGRWLFVVGHTRVATKLMLDALADNRFRLRWHMKRTQERCAPRVRKSEKAVEK